MDQTASMHTIFIMFNGFSNTFQKERQRSHRQNEQPRYHRLEQHTLNNQDPFDKINGQDFTNWSCRNLPFDGRATHDSQVRHPRKEYARSRHQRLFEENVGKTGKDVVYKL